MEPSPRISEFSWGLAGVDGHGSFKDVKLWPGGARAWNWNETGTRHRPGIQFADVQELLDHGAEIVVLSRGVDEVLQVPMELVSDLEERGIEVVVAPSREAVDLYNDLTASRPVGCLLHSTC